MSDTRFPKLVTRRPSSDAGPGARARARRGFTLVEILIVVLILGILAAIVIPQFASASTDARRTTVREQMQEIRGILTMYRMQHNDKLPDLATNQWAQLTGKTNTDGTLSATGPCGPYLPTLPKNTLNGNFAVIDSAATPASATGWVYDNTTGALSATNQTATLAFDESSGAIQ